MLVGQRLPAVTMCDNWAAFGRGEDQTLPMWREGKGLCGKQTEVHLTRERLQGALVVLLASLSLWLSAELLFLNAVVLPVMRGILAAAYRGEAHPLVNLVFQRVATDAYKIPLWMYQGKLALAYEAMKIPALVLLVGTTVYVWLSTRPREARLAIRNWPQRLAYLVFCCLLLALLVHAQLGTYSRFMADDYYTAAVAKARGIFGATVYWYLGWTGRYSFNFLVALEGALGPRVAYLSTAIILLCWFAATTLALFQFPLAQRKLPRICLSALLSAALMFSTLQISPHLPQSLYWLNGMSNVLPPLVLLAAGLGILRKRLNHEQPTKPSWVWGLTAGVLSFVAGGFSETFTVLQVSTWILIMLAGVIVDESRFKNRLLPQAAPFLLGSLAALAVVVAAPGNSNRMAVVGVHPTLMATAEIAWASTIEFVKWSFSSWQRSLSLLALLLLSALVSAGFFGTHLPSMEPTRIKVRALVLLPAATLVLLYSCFVPAAYALGGSPPGRNQIIPAFGLVCAVAYGGTIIGQLADSERRSPEGLAPRALFYVVAPCMLTLYLLTTTQATYTQLRQLPAFALYASRWDANDSRIRSALAEGANHVVVVRIPENWAGMSDREINNDPSSAANIYASQYYGIEITAEGPSSE